MRNHFFFFRLHVIFIGCCFLLFGSLANGQISWKPIENQKVSQYPVPLVKERYYELIPSKNQIKASKSNFNIINQIILPNEKGENELFLIEPVQVIASSL